MKLTDEQIHSISFGILVKLQRLGLISHGISMKLKHITSRLYKEYIKEVLLKYVN